MTASESEAESDAGTGADANADTDAQIEGAARQSVAGRRELDAPDQTPLRSPIKMRWKGTARDHVEDRVVDLADEEEDPEMARLYETLRDFKTRVEVRTVEQAEAFVTRVGRHRYEAGPNSRAWVTGQVAQACGRRADAIRERMEARGFTAEEVDIHRYRFTRDDGDTAPAEGG